MDIRMDLSGREEKAWALGQGVIHLKLCVGRSGLWLLLLWSKYRENKI